MAPPLKLPPTPDNIADIGDWLARGISYREIARTIGVDHMTVRKFALTYLPDRVSERVNGYDPPSGLLVIDIETMANLAWVWDANNSHGLFLAPNQIVQHKRTISFAARWVGQQGNTMFYSEHHHGREAMVRAAWNLIDQADAVIGYNSKRFDVKHLNTEFLLAEMDPPSSFQHIDLLSIGRREFLHGSNRLEAVADKLGIGRKREHEGFGLWLKCEAGDDEAWSRMRDYNMRDVELTEQLFERYRPWINLRGTQSRKKLRELTA